VSYKKAETETERNWPCDDDTRTRCSLKSSFASSVAAEYAYLVTGRTSQLEQQTI